MVRKKNAAQTLRDKLLDTALSAVDRLKGLLEDGDAGNGDIVKAAALVLDWAGREEAAGITGDYEIKVKEE